MSDNKDYKAFASANYILDKLAKYKIRDITNLKLQKLLYFAYGVHLSLYDKQLFDSPIQAWALGSVIPSVYVEFKDHGYKSITTRAVILKDDFSGEYETPTIDECSHETESKSLLIACVAYVKKKAWDLGDITHNKGSAWKKWYKEDESGIQIMDEDIKIEFESYMDTLAIYLLD